MYPTRTLRGASTWVCDVVASARARADECAASCKPTTGASLTEHRKAIVEPVFGVLKQLRGMRQFRTRGLSNVGNVFTLAILVYNLTRIHAA